MRSQSGGSLVIHANCATRYAGGPMEWIAASSAAMTNKGVARCTTKPGFDTAHGVTARQ